ncbi:helix-turn-helix domain-containing protein [Streptomyces sp. NPDC048718]|uniref:helix-turn-helix domain-containing protein n=1 Tax=Streptomyces sp. NPDC048718 TaxID=3365587 RepID=UPI00371697CF
MTRGESAPDARGARSPAEFIARLQALKDWSGLTYRQLSARAEARGDVLPRSTVANMLARTTVPRAELLATFVRACGATPEAAAEWEAIREDMARRARTESPPGTETGTGDPEGGDTPGEGGSGGTGAGGRTKAPRESGEPGGSGGPAEAREAGEPGEQPPVWPVLPEPAPEPGGTPGRPPTPRRTRLRRGLVVVVAVAALVTATVSIVVLLREGDRAHRNPPVLTAPADGPVRIRVIGSDLCLGERRGGRTGQIYQKSCAGAVVPLYSLKRLDGAKWRIVSDHPDYGPGCSGLPSGGRPAEAALEDSECGDLTRVERFTLEPYGTPVTGYRVRPVGSATPGTCVSVLGDPKAEWSRLAQSPCREDARGQLFSFDRRT